MRDNLRVDRSLAVKRAAWLATASTLLTLVVLFTGGVGICGPTMPKLLIAACPVLWILSGWTLWHAFRVIDEENWDKLNSRAAGIIAVCCVVSLLSALMAMMGISDL
jgi:hypothetical protein